MHPISPMNMAPACTVDLPAGRLRCRYFKINLVLWAAYHEGCWLWLQGGQPVSPRACRRRMGRVPSSKLPPPSSATGMEAKLPKKGTLEKRAGSYFTTSPWAKRWVEVSADRFLKYGAPCGSCEPAGAHVVLTPCLLSLVCCRRQPMERRLVAQEVRGHADM